MGAYLKADSPLTAENAFTVLLRGTKYVDYSAHLMRCLQTTINDANFDKVNVSCARSRKPKSVEYVITCNFIFFVGNRLLRPINATSEVPYAAENEA